MTDLPKPPSAPPIGAPIGAAKGPPDSNRADAARVQPASLPALAHKIQDAAKQLEHQFLGKEETVRLLFVAALAGEHMVMIGPPGTAKSALVRAFAEMFDAKYFEYLLTRFTEPNEIFGPVDIEAFRSGSYRRRIEGMLPTAEVAFLDEIFKANSAILNSLLSLLNSRKFMHGSKSVDVPLISLFAASNEVPSDEGLAALFDRFGLRVRVDYLDSYHFRGLMQKGMALELNQLTRDAAPKHLLTAADLLAAQRHVARVVASIDEDLLATYKGLVFQIRGEGVQISDRRVVKLLKLAAASAIFDGRETVDDSDLFVLRHVWNTPEQEEILSEVVGPVIDRWYEQHPNQPRIGVTPTSLQDLLDELELIRGALAGSQVLSDMQLFSVLRNLGDIKGALERMHDNPAAVRMIAEVDRLLESMFASSRFV